MSVTATLLLHTCRSLRLTASLAGRRRSCRTLTTTSAAESDADSDSAASAEALAGRCQQLEASLSELNDKYVRALAESENTRRRLTKQAEEARVFGISSFCKDLLEVADVLGKATESVPQESVSKAKDPHFASLYDGLRMTSAQLQQVFRRHNLDQIDPKIGEKFDPNVHEALFEVPVSAELQPGSVAVVTKVGYRLKDRTLRPALVGVVKYN